MKPIPKPARSSPEQSWLRGVARAPIGALAISAAPQCQWPAFTPPRWPGIRPPLTVVKNGSKIFSCRSWEMPAPVSDTEIETELGLRKVFKAWAWIVRTPPSGIASLAFTARLMSATSKAFESARIAGVFGSTSICRRISGLMALWIMTERCAMRSWMRKLIGSCELRRAKASRCVVRCRPRWAADAMVSAIICTRVESPLRAFRMSAPPIMIMSRLLKSCATPPVTRPSASRRSPSSTFRPTSWPRRSSRRSRVTKTPEMASAITPAETARAIERLTGTS